MIGEVVDRLPPDIKSNLHNVEFLIEDIPSPDIVETTGSRHLLGLYHGVPLNKRGRGYSFVLPDRIILYYRNISRISRTLEDWKENVREVVLHEIGHYFGFNEAEIRTLMKDG